MPKILGEQIKQVEKIKVRVKHLFTYLVKVRGEGIVDRALPSLGLSNGQRVKVYSWKDGKSIPSDLSRQHLAINLGIKEKDIEQYFEGVLHYKELLRKIFKDEKIPFENELEKYFDLSELPNEEPTASVSFFRSKALNSQKNTDIQEYLSQLKDKTSQQIVGEIKVLAEELDCLAEQVDCLASQFDRKSCLIKAIVSQLESRLSESSTNGAVKSRDFDPTLLKQVIDFTLNVRNISLEELANRVRLEKEQIELLLQGFCPKEIDKVSLDNLARHLVKTQTPMDILSFKTWDDMRKFCQF